MRWRIRHYINLNNTCKVVSSQGVSVKRASPSSLRFSGIIRTRSPFSFSSTGISSHTLMLIKSEKGIMNYIHESDSDLEIIKFQPRVNLNNKMYFLLWKIWPISTQQWKLVCICAWYCIFKWTAPLTSWVLVTWVLSFSASPILQVCIAI